MLTHFDCNLPVLLACDTSSIGLGAVLSHRMPDGAIKPIAFASRTLSQTEKRYSQLDKEALAIIFAIKKFHLFLYGRTFELWTDHKPLVYIFGSKKGIPAMAASRIQRWSFFCPLTIITLNM